jgi:hypothetical protein
MEMVWDDVKGYGFYPVEADPADVYGAEYFERYQAMSATPLGRALNEFRCDFVRQAAPRSRTVLDVGIGSGAFLDAMAERTARSALAGWDVNPAALAWLEARGLTSDPMTYLAGTIPCATFWDSLEHIPNPAAIVSRCRVACISIPIFRDQAHALASRHFRPDEHYWYFTERGLITWMKRLGFACADKSTRESELGRDGIGTYAFRRSLGCD